MNTKKNEICKSLLEKTKNTLLARILKNLLCKTTYPRRFSSKSGVQDRTEQKGVPMVAFQTR